MNERIGGESIIFETRGQLEEAATITSNQVKNVALNRLVYLHFIARYLIVIYEAQFVAIPMQVWNELRNAFDHNIRSLTSNELDSISHIKKAEGHIQRAILDCCKILCRDSQLAFENLLKTHEKSALLLIDNGHFYPKLTKKFETSKRIFLKAKISDSQLGDQAKENNNVLANYLDAFYSYSETISYMQQKSTEIESAKFNLTVAQKLAIHIGIRNGLIIGSIVALLTLVLNKLIYPTFILPKLIQFFPNLQ